MKKVFGILFAILSIISLPGISTASAPEMLGGITAWLLICVLPAILLLRGKKKDDKVDNKVEQKTRPTMKKIITIILATIGVVLVGAMVFGQIARKASGSSDFAKMVERADADCPIPLGLGNGAVTGIKLEKGFVTYYLAYNQGFFNLFSQMSDDKVKHGLLMCILCNNAQGGGQGDMLMDILDKYGYGLRIVITESANGQFECRATIDEIKALREQYKLNPHEAMYNLLAICIEAERTTLPMQIDQGLTMADYKLDNGNIVICIEVDEDYYSIDELSANKSIFKEAMFVSALNDPESYALLSMCKISHTGLEYRFAGGNPKKEFGVELTSDEIRKRVPLPGMLDVQ